MLELIERLAYQHLSKYVEALVFEVYQANFDKLQADISNLRVDNDSDLGVIFRKITEICALRLELELKNELEKLPYQSKTENISGIFENITCILAENFKDNLNYQDLINFFLGDLWLEKSTELIYEGKINGDWDYLHLPRA